MSTRGWADPANVASHHAVCRALRAVPRRTLAAIGVEFGISAQRVSAIAAVNGLRRKKVRKDAKPKAPQRLTDLGLLSLRKRNAIILALAAGVALTVTEIAELLAMTPSAVSHVKRRYK